MAHFAELDENNIVLRVIVVNDSDTSDANGVEDEELGIAFCKRLFGVDTKWKQTSYNKRFCVHYAGIGFSYDETLNAFVPPKPYPSWLLDTDTATWQAPVPKPDLTPEEQASHYFYEWNEAIVNWELNTPKP